VTLFDADVASVSSIFNARVSNPEASTVAVPSESAARSLKTVRVSAVPEVSLPVTFNVAASPVISMAVSS
jgi:hypothetical protein